MIPIINSVFGFVSFFIIQIIEADIIWKIIAYDITNTAIFHIAGD